MKEKQFYTLKYVILTPFQHIINDRCWVHICHKNIMYVKLIGERVVSSVTHVC